MIVARLHARAKQSGSPLDTVSNAYCNESVSQVFPPDLAPISHRPTVHSMLRLETAVYAALRLDSDITAGEAEVAARASNGAHPGGPRCTELQRGPQRVRLHPHHPLCVLADDCLITAKTRLTAVHRGNCRLVSTFRWQQGLSLHSLERRSPPLGPVLMRETKHLSTATGLDNTRYDVFHSFIV